MPLGDVVEQNKNILSDNRAEFKRIFGIDMVGFMHPLLGFDIIKFDDYVKTPDGESLHDFIGRKYGDEAIAIIEKIIN